MKPVVHQLRVNVKSLAAEARFIREEIRRTRNQEAKESLASHRSYRLKPEARMAHLALAFVKGVPYRRVEAKAKNPPEFATLLRKLKRFQCVYEPDLQNWLEGR